MATFERVWLVEARYVADGASARAPHRDTHLTRAAELRAAGIAVLVGSFDDVSASVMVFRLPDEAAVRALVEADVYWVNRVWTSYAVRALNVLTD